MKLKCVFYRGSRQLDKGGLYGAIVEGKRQELEVLADKFRDAEGLLAIETTCINLSSGMEAVQPTKKEPSITMRYTYILQLNFQTSSNDVPQDLSDIASNIQHLID